MISLISRCYILGVHSTNSAAIDLYTRKLDFRIVHSKMSEDGDIDYVLEKLLS